MRAGHAKCLVRLSMWSIFVKIYELLNKFAQIILLWGLTNFTNLAVCYKSYSLYIFKPLRASKC
jgi:hypothetical protein